MDTSTNSNREIPKQYVRGWIFPALITFPRENIESAIDYKPEEGEIILVTYPKAGTTWTQYIIYEILHGCEGPLPTMDEMEQIVPFMESKGAEAALRLAPPRMIKYHLPYHLTPKSPHAKYIYVIRNPYDVVVSYFHFLRKVTKIDLQFDEFYDSFVSGDFTYGDYFDHVTSWYDRRNEPNVLVISYDKMVLNPKKGLFKIARFLGEEHFNRLTHDDTLVEKILQRTSFTFMKKYLSEPKDERKIKDGGQEDSNLSPLVPPEIFFRKGIVGDWRNNLTEEQVGKMKRRIIEKTSGTEIQKFWKV